MQINKNVSIVLGVILAIVILGGLVFVVGSKVYRGNSAQIQTPVVKQERGQQAKDVVEQKTQTDTIADTVNPGNKSVCETGDNTYFEVKEFGIKFLVSRDLKDDLTYSVYTPDPADPSHVVAAFSTKALTVSDRACSAENGGSIGSIYKIQGQANKVDGGFFAGKKEFVKQFQYFFVVFQRPQAVCSEKKAVQEKTIQFANKLESEFAKNIDCLEKM